MKTVEERFFDKVEKTDTCWLWTAALDDKGYGFLKVKRGGKWKRVGAHRVSFMLFYGPIPSGLGVLHSCHNARCVNPHHLRAGTQKENGQDMVKHGTAAMGERNGNSRLTQEQVDRIRVMYASGSYSQHAIANMFGVSRSLISPIVNGKIWKAHDKVAGHPSADNV